MAGMIAARGAVQRRLHDAQVTAHEGHGVSAPSMPVASTLSKQSSVSQLSSQMRGIGARMSMSVAQMQVPKEIGNVGEGDEDEDSDRIYKFSTKGLQGTARRYIQLCNLAINALNAQWFNSSVMLSICWASISVGLQTYPELSDNVVLNVLDYIVLTVFILECLLKILAEGLVPFRYFIGPEMHWNNFDFAIIIMSLPMWGSALGGGNIAILRLFRLLRIMKLVKRVPQLYMIIMGLIGGVKSIGYILLLLFLVFYLYAVSGMYAWQDNDPFHFRNVPIAMITLFRMSTLENWSNIMNINYFGCDRFNGGFYTSNPDDAIYNQYCNVTAVYGADTPISSIETQRVMNSVLAVLFFITFVLISAFVMLSLFIGAITMSMTQSMEQMKVNQEEVERKARLDKVKRRAIEAQKKEAAAAKRSGGHTMKKEEQELKPKNMSAAEKRDQMKMQEVLRQTWGDYDLNDLLIQEKGDHSSLRGRYLLVSNAAGKLVENPHFSMFITGVIVLAGIMVGLQTIETTSEAVAVVLNVIDTAILVVFTTEVVLKLVAEGVAPWTFFRSGWNTFDFIIVIGSFTKGSGGMLTMLRLLRLLRVLKLVRAFPQLQVIVSALMKGVSSIGYIGLILLLCFYVFGIIGNMLFADNDPFHFKYLHYAMITLFQLSTMDSWTDTLYINFYGCENYVGYQKYRDLGYDCGKDGGTWLAIVYFLAFIVLGGMVLITLFIGVVTTSMEEATQEMEAEKRLIQRVEDLRERKNIDPEVVASFMKVFRLLDLDNSGSVEEAELRIGLAAIGKHPTHAELREMMDVVDEDGSGQIDVVEFVEFMINVREKAKKQKAEADGVFSSTDLNDSDAKILEETDDNTVERGKTSDLENLEEDEVYAVRNDDDVFRVMPARPDIGIDTSNEKAAQSSQAPEKAPMKSFLLEVPLTLPPLASRERGSSVVSFHEDNTKDVCIVPNVDDEALPSNRDETPRSRQPISSAEMPPTPQQVSTPRAGKATNSKVLPSG